MSYQVEAIHPSGEAATADYEAKKYPLDGYKGSIKSKLSIAQSSFDTDDKYRIVLHQSNDYKSFFFLLYEGTRLDATKEAFNRLESTLSPLLCSGTIFLTKDLLKELTMPEPLVNEEKMIIHLLNVIEADPEAHQDWLPVVNILNCYPNLQESEDEEEEEEVEEVDAGFICVDNNSDRDNDISQKIWDTYFKEVKTSSSVVLTKKILEVAADAFSSLFKRHNKSCLLIAIEKNCVNSALSLLLAGCDPNTVEKFHGTALHAAVIEKQLTMVKLLIAFNADPTILNDEDKSPIDLADPTSEIHKCLEKAKEAQAKTRKHFSSNLPLPVPKDTSDVYLLSIDGGGIRGFNSIQYLIAVQERMKELDSSSKPLPSYFDYIAGTSAGGISALVLLYTNLDMYCGRYFLYKVITDVFDKKLENREKLIDEYLINIFGREKVMADLKGSQRIIITATLANRGPNKLHLMTNYGGPRDDQLGPNERTVLKAARITSAAPFLFPAIDERFLDGGLMANNPTLDSMTEIIEQDENVKFGCILSVGSGTHRAPKEVKHVNTFVPGFSLETIVRIPNTLKGIKSLFEHFIVQVTQSNGQEVERARAWSKSCGWPYYRLCPELYGKSKDISPACTDRKTIIDMLYHTQLHILEQPELIDSVAKKILEKQVVF